MYKVLINEQQKEVKRLDTQDQKIDVMRKTVQDEVQALRDEAKLRVAPEKEQAQYGVRLLLNFLDNLETS